MSSRLAFALACAALWAGPALAGSGNTLYLLQDSTVRPDLGNTFVSDQTGGDFTLIGLPWLPATQKGANNDADLLIEGAFGAIQLLQDNALVIDDPQGNTAAVSVSGYAVGAELFQRGDANTALMNVDGFFAKGLVDQQGDGNRAELAVEGSLAAGSIFQQGDNNLAQLAVSGFSDVTYTQIGDNLVTPVPVQVWSNAGSVSITQTTN